MEEPGPSASPATAPSRKIWLPAACAAAFVVAAAVGGARRFKPPPPPVVAAPVPAPAAASAPAAAVPPPASPVVGMAPAPAAVSTEGDLVSLTPTSPQATLLYPTECPAGRSWESVVAAQRQACAALPLALLTTSRQANGSYTYVEVAACPAHMTPMRGTGSPLPGRAAACSCAPDTCGPFAAVGHMGQ